MDSVTCDANSVISFSANIQTMAKNKALCICLFGLWYLHSIDALKITSLDVPKTASWDSVKLNCRYDLEGENLYAVKWYKDQREFFRCFADGSVQEFPTTDIKIYHSGRSQIGSCFFDLTALTPKSGGEYTCEVSLEWPTFQTVKRSAFLQIAEPSKRVQPEETTEGRSFAVENRSNYIGLCRISAFVNIIIIFFVI